MVLLYAHYGRIDPSGGQQSFFDDDQIGQDEQYLMLGAIILGSW